MSAVAPLPLLPAVGAVLTFLDSDGGGCEARVVADGSGDVRPSVEVVVLAEWDAGGEPVDGEVGEVFTLFEAGMAAVVATCA